ncbi:rod shape-determining protein MreC [Candidatus Uhrbacteria bacterium]|nr:rod shape-determining protein MreC [Candidatus Uhrbacteria bacterium]
MWKWIFLIGAAAIAVFIPLFDTGESIAKKSIGTAVRLVADSFPPLIELLSSDTSQETVESLREERNRCIAQSIESKLLHDENNKLKSMLSFRDTQDLMMVTAHIIGRTTDPAQSMITIDRGTRDGLRIGLPVVAHDGTLIGRIGYSEHAISGVKLLNSPGNKTLAAYESASNTFIQGVVEGKFQTGLQLSLIPITEPAERGLMVFTSGLENDIPRGLLIGFLSDVTAAPADLFYTITIRPAIQISSVRDVGILVKPTHKSGE